MQANKRLLLFTFGILKHQETTNIQGWHRKGFFFAWQSKEEAFEFSLKGLLLLQISCWQVIWLEEVNTFVNSREVKGDCCWDGSVHTVSRMTTILEKPEGMIIGVMTSWAWHCRNKQAWGGEGPKEKKMMVKYRRKHEMQMETCRKLNFITDKMEADFA